MVRAPLRDPQFAEHPVHGAMAQRWLIRDAIRFCARKRAAIDAGAHIGLTANVLAEYFDSVLAFEPVAENFECLQENAADNVVCVDEALGAEPGLCALELPEKGNSGCWRVAQDGTVRVRTIDSLNMQGVDFLKLDVEGSEGSVLRGSVETIERCRPVVLFESNGLGEKFYGEKWIDPADVLSEMGYTRATRLHKNEVWTCGIR